MSKNEVALAQSSELGFLQSAAKTFEGIERLAALMAKCGTMPRHLQGKPADCFRVVVQAANWKMDPFVVGECTSIVHGKLCYEGKLINAVLQSMSAIQGSLDFEFSGEPRTERRTVKVTGKLPDGRVRKITGSVADWKTVNKSKNKDGANYGMDISPWAKPGNWDRQLVYRGTREWARIWAPAAVMGVYIADEMRHEEVIKDADASVVEEEDLPKPNRRGKAKEAEETPATDSQPEAEEPTDEVDIMDEINAVISSIKKKADSQREANRLVRPLTEKFGKKITECEPGLRPDLLIELQKIESEMGAE